MALKLNRKIKLHIAQIATREKFKAEFDSALEEFKADVCKSRKVSGSHADILNRVPDDLLRFVKCSSEINMGYSSGLVVGNCHIAMQSRENIRHIQIETIYGASAPGNQEVHRIKLEKKIKEINGFQETLLDAMACFKSSSKMFVALPWAEKYYPEAEKTPACNIVPVTTINKANELMGVSNEN